MNKYIKMMVGRFLSCGAWAGKVFCMVMIIDYLLWRLLQLLQVRIDIFNPCVTRNEMSPVNW